MSDQQIKQSHDNSMTNLDKIGWFFLGLTVTGLIFYILDQTPTVAYSTFTYLVVIIIVVAEQVGKNKGGGE